MARFMRASLCCPEKETEKKSVRKMEGFRPSAGFITQIDLQCAHKNKYKNMKKRPGAL